MEVHRFLITVPTVPDRGAAVVMIDTTAGAVDREATQYRLGTLIQHQQGIAFMDPAGSGTRMSITGACAVASEVFT